VWCSVEGADVNDEDEKAGEQCVSFEGFDRLPVDRPAPATAGAACTDTQTNMSISLGHKY